MLKCIIFPFFFVLLSAFLKGFTFFVFFLKFFKEKSFLQLEIQKNTYEYTETENVIYATALLWGMLYFLWARGAENLWSSQGYQVQATRRGAGKCQRHFAKHTHRF